MKQRLWCAAWLALAAAPVPAATLVFDASPRAVLVGEAFTMDVRVVDAVDLYAFQFDLAFDPAVLQAAGVEEGGFLPAGGATTSFVPGSIDNASGMLSFTGGTRFGPGAGASGQGVLVRLSFQGAGVGSSALDFGNVVLLDSALAELQATAVGGAVTVSAVPEPAAGVLWGIGLAALRAWRRRQG